MAFTSRNKLKLWFLMILWGLKYQLNLATPTFSGETDTGFFWHVTDLHWDPSYNESVAAVSCGSSKDGDSFGPYGDYRCDSPWPLINSSVHAMRNIRKDVDFIIWTGDDTPHNKEISKNEVANIISKLTNQILDVFPNTTVYPVLGNHDWSPKSQIPPRNDTFYERIAHIWSDWLIDTVANKTFCQSGYYSMKLNENILVVGLNTNLYYTNNALTVLMPDPGNQLQWLDDILTHAATNTLKVLLIGHVPPGQFEKHANKYWFQPHFNQVFVGLLRKHSGVFGSLHFGHHHTDSFRLFNDEKGGPIGSFFIAPSVTPWKTTLPGVMGGAGNNPGIRLVEYNRKDGTVVNIKQYYLNLTAANIYNLAEWKIAYDAREYYGQPDMTTASLSRLAQSLWTDDALFQKYYQVNGLYFDMNDKWTTDYRNVHCCAITELDYKNYTTCIQAHSSSTSPPSSNSKGHCVELNSLVCYSTVVLSFILRSVKGGVGL